MLDEPSKNGGAASQACKGKEGASARIELSRENIKLSDEPYTVKYLPLSQGLFTVIDSEDFERCNKFKWCAMRTANSFYATRKVRITPRKRASQLLSRFIMGITDREIDVDHINHNTLDNRKENLKPCSHRQNMWNLNPKRKKSSNFTGVCREKRAKPWKAYIRISGKLRNIGNFSEELEAATAYRVAFTILVGETP
jgi:hypothetical protein